MKTIACLLLFLVFPAMALPDKPEKGVVYVEEFAPKGIKLKVEKPGWVYSTKQGGRKRGSLKVGIDVELVSTRIDIFWLEVFARPLLAVFMQIEMNSIF